MSVFFKYARDMRAYLKWYLKWYLNVIFVSVFVIQIYRFVITSFQKRYGVSLSQHPKSQFWILHFCKRKMNEEPSDDDHVTCRWWYPRAILRRTNWLYRVDAIRPYGNEIKEAARNFGTWNDVSDYWYKIERMYFIYGGLPYHICIFKYTCYLKYQVDGRDI